jgi:hypothetical protein
VAWAMYVYNDDLLHGEPGCRLPIRSPGNVAQL